MWAEGPYVALTAQRRSRGKVLLVAGGVGITPMRALFETLPGASGDITLLYRANSTQTWRCGASWPDRRRAGAARCTR
ncbi:hypothetical protein GCM10023238_33540 [Streptomyces heliomycini]